MTEEEIRKEHKALLQRQVALADLMAELDRVMPKTVHWRSSFEYECLICGSYVKNRLKHLRWHRGSDMVDILVKLFGRPGA